MLFVVFLNARSINRMAQGKRNWLIDAFLFVGFLLTFFLDLTGLTIHQWLGVGVGFFALYHILAHWKWVLAVTRRIFGRTSGQSRIYYLIDWNLLISGFVIGVSGIVISTWLNINLANYLFWKDLHIYSSIVGLVIILVKIAVHWRWIVKTASKYFGVWRQTARTPAASPLHSSSAPGTLHTREFLQLMGVASLASLVSASNLLEFGQETGQEIINKQLSSAAVPDTATASSSCTVICDRGCSYPGECRRYIDQNGNGICDLTECLSGKSDSASQSDSLSTPQDKTQQSAPGEEITSETEDGCVILCPSACAYPGECKDYVDNDGNNLCDLGECLVSNTLEAAVTSNRGRQHRGGK